MGLSYDLADIPTFYHDFLMEPYLSEKIKVWSLDLNLCPHQGLTYWVGKKFFAFFSKSFFLFFNLKNTTRFQQCMLHYYL